MEKPYKLGILVGRFQTIHKGHEEMINKAIALCETVGILVGSCDESGTSKNPFSFEERKEMLNALFGGKIKIIPLKDIGVGNNFRWGDYVIENVKKEFGIFPDLLISGKEQRRTSWYDEQNIAELFIPKSIDISASEIREYIINDNLECFKKYTNEKLWGKYEFMRKKIILSKDIMETSSI